MAVAVCFSLLTRAGAEMSELMSRAVLTLDTGLRMLGQLKKCVLGAIFVL